MGHFEHFETRVVFHECLGDFPFSFSGFFVIAIGCPFFGCYNGAPGQRLANSKLADSSKHRSSCFYLVLWQWKQYVSTAFYGAMRLELATSAVTALRE